MHHLVRKAGIPMLMAAFLCVSPVLTYGGPILINTMFQEIGNDVKATFTIQDLGTNSIDNLPLTFLICLVEVDIIFNDLLGAFALTLDESDVTQNQIGGYETTNPIMHTYQNASNAFTGFGDDYALELKIVPEPSTYLLFATGLLGIIGYGWRKRKQSIKG
jgi:hypothetical protein